MFEKIQSLKDGKAEALLSVEVLGSILKLNIQLPQLKEQVLYFLFLNKGFIIENQRSYLSHLNKVDVLNFTIVM